MKIVSLVESFLSSKQELVDSKVTSTNFFYPSTSTSTSEFSSSSTSRIYRELKQECLNQNRLFIDSEFPPNNESLFLDDSRWSGTDLEIEWKRPGEIVDDPKLFVEGASPFDVTQGILGNCWFVSACSALTNSDALLCKVIPDGQEWGASGNTYAGIFQFCFWRYGRWVDIIIDDLLPCKGGKLLFAHSKTDNEFWSALLEKAFAKFYGCYENLVGGQLADALQDVSGGVVETHYVRRFMYQHTKTTNSVNNTNDLHVPKVLNNTTNGNLTSLSVYKADFTASKRLFYALKHAFNRNALIVAAISAKNEEVEKSLDCGLVMGHAYAITSIQFIELDALQLFNRNRTDRGRQSITMRQAMVRLQNPWGEKEWNGPWCDGASEWDQITSEQKHRLGITDNEDGEFWMPWEEFLKYFTDISVCQLLMPLESGISGEKVHISMKASRRSNATGPMDRRYYEWDFYGCWTTNNVKSGAPLDRSGGCPNFAATFCFNPQFLFEVPGQGSAEVIFALNKPDLFLGKKKLSYLAAGMQLIRVERNRRHRLHRPLPNTATSEYSSGRSVLLHLDKLPPGRYILIVSSFAPREIGEFLVRIYATQRLNPCPLENDTPVAALCKFGLRIRCLIRLHILEVIIPSYNQRKGGLFCLLTTSTGERIRTIGAVHLGPKLSFKFNGECFIFHSLCPSMRFTFEIFEKNFPFRLGNKYLGRAKILVNADQNDRIRFDLALRKPSYNHSFVMASLLFSNVVAKRRTGSKNRPFDARPGMGGLMKEDSEDKNVAEESAHLENISWKNIRSGTMSIKNTYETVNKKINVDMIQKKNFEEELAMKIIDSGVNFTEELYVEDKEIWRNLSALPGAGEKNIFWIDATFKAVDLGINISGVSQCITWHHFWETKDNSSNVERLRVLRNRTIGESSSDELVRYEVFERGDRLLQLIPSSVIDELFDNEGFEAIGILWQEICGEHKRDFFYTSPEDAKAIGIDNGSIICEPFRKELHPDISTLINLEKRMTKLIGWNFTYEDENNESNTTTYLKKKVKSRQIEERNQIAKTEEEMEEAIRNRTESATASKTKKPVEVDVSDETSPLLVFSSAIVSDALGLRIAPLLFHRHQRVGLALQGICSDYIPTAIEAFNVSEFEGIEIEGPIGVNISALENAGVNLTELAEKLRNDTEVDDILSRTTDMDKQVGGSFILPVLTKNQYDPFSPPIVFQGSAVVVRFGIYIESISNFQTSTMDYDMDIYLMMSWRDPRLVSGLTTILVKEEEIMEKIWRPDPFFDVKEAEFHEVTFLNFLMRIFNDGLVLYETRIKLKPACNLVLCKYPHDKQTCELKIKSFAYPLSAVRFEWFSNRKNAIDKNPEVRLPELYIDNYEPAKCNKSRKSGEFACLRAIFRLKRDVGFHIAQTYIPTSLALMFSWVGVWLPEEFMEGRIGVAITV